MNIPSCNSKFMIKRRSTTWLSSAKHYKNVYSCRGNKGKICLVANKHGERHEDTTYADIRTQPLAYPRALPEDAHQAILVPVENRGEHLMYVGRGADEEDDD